LIQGIKTPSQVPKLKTNCRYAKSNSKFTETH